MSRMSQYTHRLTAHRKKVWLFENVMPTLGTPKNDEVFINPSIQFMYSCSTYLASLGRPNSSILVLVHQLLTIQTSGVEQTRAVPYTYVAVAGEDIHDDRLCRRPQPLGSLLCLSWPAGRGGEPFEVQLTNVFFRSSMNLRHYSSEFFLAR